MKNKARVLKGPLLVFLAGGQVRIKVPKRPGMPLHPVTLQEELVYPSVTHLAVEAGVSTSSISEAIRRARPLVLGNDQGEMPVRYATLKEALSIKGATRATQLDTDKPIVTRKRSGNSAPPKPVDGPHFPSLLHNDDSHLDAPTSPGHIVDGLNARTEEAKAVTTLVAIGAILDTKGFDPVKKLDIIRTIVR
jgi:hypothetical protein